MRVCMCVHDFFSPVKSDVGWVTMTGVPPTIPSRGENCSATRKHFYCLPARERSEQHFTVCVQVQWSLFFLSVFFHRCQVFLGRLTTIFFIPCSWTTRPWFNSTHELCRDLVFEVNPTGLMLLFCTIVCKAGPASWARWCTWGRCHWRTYIRRTTLAKHAN